MSTTPSPDRRFIMALTAAVASATLAIGVTTGSLLGWIGPRTTEGSSSSPAPASAAGSPVVYVPITPTAPPPPPIESSTASDPRVALAETGSHRDDRDDRDDRRDDRGDHEEDDDD